MPKKSTPLNLLYNFLTVSFLLLNYSVACLFFPSFPRPLIFTPSPSISFVTICNNSNNINNDNDNDDNNNSNSSNNSSSSNNSDSDRNNIRH